MYVDADAFSHAQRDTLIGALGEIDSLCVHAADVVADLVSMVALAGIVGDQHDADGKRNQEDRAQRVEPQGRDAGVFRAA